MGWSEGVEMLTQRRRTRGQTHPRHRYPRTALLIGAGLVALLVVWMLVGVPSLVKYPTDLEADQAFEGTFTVLVDPTSAAPLEEPLVLPLQVDRHIDAIGEESGADEVVVRETIEERAGDLVDITQVNQYVMDRSGIENVADERAYAFEPDNVVDRSGSYRLHLPFDTNRDETYDIYSPETDTTYAIAVDPGRPTSEVEGLTLSNFVANEREVPVTDAYLRDLGEAVPLPRELTLEQLDPHLLAAGIDVDGLLAALLPVLSPEDTATLVEFAGQPIGLEYVLSFSGRLGIGTVVFLRRRPRPLDLSPMYTTPPVPHPADEARPTIPSGR